MTNEEKAENLESWARFFKRNPERMAHYQRLVDEKRAHMPPDTRRGCCVRGCPEPAMTGLGGPCAAHYADGVL